MLDLTAIQETLIEKNINLFYIFVGVVFASLPSLIAGKRFTSEEIVEWLYILGILIIIVHASIILKYHYDKNKELTENYKNQNMFDNPDVINYVITNIDKWETNKDLPYPFGSKYDLTIPLNRKNIYNNNKIIKDYIDKKSKNFGKNTKKQTLVMAWNDEYPSIVDTISSTATSLIDSIKQLVNNLKSPVKSPVNEEYTTEYQDLFIKKVEKSKTKDIFKQEFLSTELRTAIYNDSRYKSILDSNGFTSDWL